MSQSQGTVDSQPLSQHSQDDEDVTWTIAQKSSSERSYCCSDKSFIPEYSSDPSEDEISQEDSNPEIKSKRVIVDETCLLQLFKVCQEPMCGSSIDVDDLKIIEVGAALKVAGVCLNGHHFTWESSQSLLEGRRKVYTINILMAAYTLFCGLNISQVYKHS